MSNSPGNAVTTARNRQHTAPPATTTIFLFVTRTFFSDGDYRPSTMSFLIGLNKLGLLALADVELVQGRDQIANEGIEVGIGMYAAGRTWSDMAGQ